jgi:hypothetical protein
VITQGMLAKGLQRPRQVAYPYDTVRHLNEASRRQESSKGQAFRTQMQGAKFGSNIKHKEDRETGRGPSVRRRWVHDLSLLGIKCSMPPCDGDAIAATVLLVL